MAWNIDDPQGDEASKVKYDIVQYTRGAVLDLGCGPAKAFPHFIGVDSCKDTALFGIAIKPDVNCDVSDPEAIARTFEPASCDAIFSAHCLEHIQDYQAALRAWWDILKVGGHLCLYLPHKELYPNIGTEGANPDHKHDFVPENILLAVDGFTHNFDIVLNETRDAGFEYSFLLVLQKTSEPMRDGYTCDQLPPDKTVCVVRYGGFGDMIQASNILPALKRAGCHVTLMTTPKGQDILKEDPHVDAWFIQDNDQVPNHELGLFWKSQAKRFDRFINLSESIEGTLLALPGRTNHAWPHSVRAVELNRNYLEWTAQLAELPYTSEARFYPTREEEVAAESYLAKLADKTFSILWVLAGSSVHKFTPHQDTIIARVLLELPGAQVIFSGDDACTILEVGWENEARVHCESGKLGIRQTLALAQQVDCVVGPETGVLNAVAFEPNAKVMLLSHSSAENLSKHWLNTVALSAPEDLSVPLCGNRACHRLHYGREFCPHDEDTGAAMCQVAITPESVFDAIAAAYRIWRDTP